MLICENVRVRYGEACVLAGVDLRIRAGEWWMLIGPNGAGKSTLVNAIARSVPYEGRVLFNGVDTRSLRHAQFARHIGVLSQRNLANYAFRVEEIVRMGRYAYRGMFSGGDPESARYVEEALRVTGLLPLRDKSILALSGGELQRVFLAQVFAQNPDELILDEPANHLDLVYQQQIFGLIGDWLRCAQRAVLCVVHDLSLAARYGTHALLLDRGRTAACATVREALAPEMLRRVYGIDVYQWMRSMYALWKGEGI